MGDTSRKRLTNWALGFGVLCACLLLAEVVVRHTVWVRRGTPYALEDSVTVYRNRPLARGMMVAPGEYAVRFSINARGLRSPERAYGRSGRIRILCLGDSFTFGTGAGDEATWPAALERRLNAEAPGAYETINAGVQGWGLAEYLIWLRREGYRYAPDVVVAAVHASDWLSATTDLVSVGADGSLETHRVVRRDVARLKRITRWIPLYDALMTHSALANLVKFMVMNDFGLGATPRASFQPLASAEADFRATWQVNRLILDELAAFSEGLGAALLVVFIPDLATLTRAPARKVADEVFRTHLLAYCDSTGLDHVDLTAPFSAAVPGWPAALYHARDGHLTEAGYAAMAGIVHAHLRAGALRRVP